MFVHPGVLSWRGWSRVVSFPASLIHHTAVRKMCAASPVYTFARKHGERVAICDERGDHTYSQLYDRAKSLAGNLKLNSTGSRVALLTPNSSDYVVGQWAVWMAGGVAVPLCKTHPLASLRYYVEDSEAEVILATTDMAPKVTELNKTILTFNGETESIAHGGGGHSDPTLPIDSPAMILYTSGTTGPPKGVVLTHRNLENQAGCLLDAWKWRETDRILHVLPLHHTHGIVNCLLCPLTIGASVHMLNSFDAGKVWTILTDRSYKVNVFMAVPTIYAKLLEHFTKTNMAADSVTEACADIRLMVSGSAALPTPVLEEWRAVTGHTLLERYGMTEIGMALSNPLEGERVAGSVGSPLPGVTARIVRWSDGGKAELLAEGCHQNVSTSNSEEGELLIRGPNVFKEYHNKPEATKKEFTEDGWFKTGDTCKVENGVFKILGRTSVDIIKSGGYKISALDVERILLSHPQIQDVAVVGVPDQTYGQRVGAVVVGTGSEAELTLDTLRSWCKERMAKYWIPTELRLLQEMPRNAMGKVNKKELIKDIFGAK